MENSWLVVWNQPANKHTKAKPRQHKNKNKKETTPCLHVRMSVENISKNCCFFFLCQAEHYSESEVKERVECESQAHRGTDISWWPLSWVIWQGSILYGCSFSHYKKQETNTSACHLLQPHRVILWSFFCEISLLVYYLFLHSVELFWRKTSAKQIHCSICIVF